MSLVRKSAAFILGGNLISKIISFAGSVILARILFPEDYGYLLIASIFTGLINTLGNAGFENFYLQEKVNNEELKSEILNVTSFLRIVFNTILFILQFVLSYVIELYYHELIVGQLLRLFSFNYLITAFSSTSLYILRKELDFRPETYANFFRDVVGAFLKVTFAYMGFGALSFAIGILAGNIVRTSVILSRCFYLPSIRKWDKEIFKKVVNFGKHSLASSVGIYFVNQFDKILLSKMFPKETIGLYNFGETQGRLVFDYFVAPLSGLIISFLANNKERKDYVFDSIKYGTYIIAIFLIPVVLFFGVYSNQIFLLVFGAKWLVAVPLFRLFLGYYFVSQIYLFSVSGVLISIGKPEIISKLVWSKGVVLLVILGFLFYIKVQILSYAAVFMIVSVFFAWLKAFISIQQLGHSFFKYLAVGKIPLLCGIVIFFLLFGFNTYITNNSSDIVKLIYGGVAVFFIYMGLQLFIFPKYLIYALDFFLFNQVVYENFRLKYLEKIYKLDKLN